MKDKENIIWETSYFTTPNGLRWKKSIPYRIDPDTGKRERIVGAKAERISEFDIVRRKERNIPHKK